MTDAAPAMSRDPAAAGSARYSTVAIVLHWLIAAAIVLQVTLSFRMEGPRTPVASPGEVSTGAVGAVWSMTSPREALARSLPAPSRATTHQRWTPSARSATGVYSVVVAPTEAIVRPSSSTR